MPDLSEYDLKENVILALKRRQFLDYDRQRESYQLHPLIQEKAYRLLCQHPEHFRTANQQAYRYFLNIPLKPKTEWKSIHDIKPLLLAHHHACQAEDWDEAENAISDACESLHYWSHFKLLIYLYSKLIPVDWKTGGKLVTSTATHIDIFCQLGLVYHLIPLEDLQDLIAQTEQKKGLQDPSLASLYASIGKIYYRRIESGECENFQQEYELAIEYFKKTIALQQKSDMEAELSSSLNYLALLYQSQGKHAEAEPLLLQAVEIFRSKLPENHPNVLIVWKNYVRLWREGITKGIFTFEQLQEHPFGEQLLAELQK